MHQLTDMLCSPRREARFESARILAAVGRENPTVLQAKWSELADHFSRLSKEMHEDGPGHHDESGKFIVWNDSNDCTYSEAFHNDKDPVRALTLPPGCDF